MRLKTYLEVDREELTQASVIVEAWKHINYGKGRRAFLAEFTEEERSMVRYWYKKAYTWYMVRGFPEIHLFRSINSYNFFLRVCNFFASV